MSKGSIFLIPRIHTEFLVIIFDRAENRSSTLVWETRGDCCLKSLKRKADYFILTTSSEKNFRLIASRKEKIHEILWKSRFRVETIRFLLFFRAAYLRRGPSKTVAFFRTPSKIFMSGTWNFRIIEKNVKAIFREYFSSLREDSGKIFKLMTFRRRPRTTYCIWTQCILESLLTKSLELLNRWKSTKDSLQPTKYYDNSFIEDSAVSLSTWIWDFSRQGWTNSVQTVFKGEVFYRCEMCYMQSWSCSLSRQALFFVEEWHITRRLLCFLFRWLYYWGLSNIEKFFKNYVDCFQDGEKHS